MMSDKIKINGIEFYGYHGVYQEEKNLGQRFQIDLTLFLPLKKAGKTDNLEETVNYGEIFALVKEIFKGEVFDLLEAAAYRIITGLLDEFSEIEKIKIEIRKPSVPIAGIMENVAVEMEETRANYCR